MHRTTAGARRIAVAAAVAVVTCGALLAPAAPAGAAGVTTHGWMAVEAIDRVGDPGLHALLDAHRDQVRSGAMFPDAGYVGTNTFGEEAHWQRFVDAYIDQLHARTDCGDLTDPQGPCAEMIAHILGVAAHGMGDEVWDWLFEPYGPDLDEYWTDPSVPLANEGGAEIQMDLVAVGVHHIPRPVIQPLPSTPALLAAFEAAGLHGVTASQFNLNGLGEIVWDLETQWAGQHLDEVMAAMPWMSANMVTAPGGVNFAATAIAGYWGSLWGRILGDQPATTVSITYPAPNQVDVPASGWERSFSPGSGRGRGGARNRITAVLSYSRPYEAADGSGPQVVNQIPAGNMTITERGSTTPLPVMAGYPQSVPYRADTGEHLVDVQPAQDLTPCTWYDVAVSVSEPLIDGQGLPVTPYTWSFRTDDGAGGTECAAAESLTGTVTGPGGAAAAGVTVSAYRPTDGFLPTASATTASDGTYALTGLADGEYRLLFTPAAGSTLAGTWSGGSLTRTRATSVDLPGPVSVVDAQLVAAAPVSGRVTGADGEALGGVRVWAFNPDDTWFPSSVAVTAADGTYQLVGLPPSEYALAFLPPAGSDLAVRWYQGAPNRQAVVRIVNSGGPVTGVDERFTAAGSVTGSVTGPGGVPVPGARVVFFGPTDTWMGSYEARTDAAGSYVLTGLAPATYHVRFVPPAGAGLQVQWFGGTADRRLTTPVVVSGPTRLTDVSASLGAAPSS